jgi:polyphosphate kinase
MTTLAADQTNGPDFEPSQNVRILNRELSWLDFDRRVLELAADERLPLLERVKLCSIVSSNLDEFFAVRIARLQRDLRRPRPGQALDGRSPSLVLAEARRRVVAIQEAQSELWRTELQPLLTSESIRIVSIDECSQRELRTLRHRFDRELGPLLTPIAVGASAPFPAVQSLALNIALLTTDGCGVRKNFVRVNVPRDVPRFLNVGSDGVRVALEDVVLHFLPTVLDSAIESSAVFRVTRDAELSPAAGTDDLRHAVEVELLRRRFGRIVRLEIAADAPDEIVEFLRRGLRVGRDDVYESDAPLGLRDLSEIAAEERPDLKYASWRPLTRRTFSNPTSPAVLARIGQGDLLAHHPYDSFESSVQAFADCARDADVAAFKATVYRTGPFSPTLASLIATANEEKEAVGLIELKARFDEHCNIGWARRLQHAGVDVVYGARDLKVHAKLALLVRREGGGIRRYVHVGTGNYHVSNASQYEDLSLFTADEDIAADVADLFNAVTARTRPFGFRKLLVGPWFLRDGILHEIARVTAAAEASKNARIRIKVNALVDPEIVEALYAASSAGAEIEIVTRGICVLRPGVRGLSERITVRSVLGRFLEHSRVFSIQIGDQTKTWIGSADLMPRNLDRRIEVLVPLEDARLRSEVDVILDALLRDTHSSWELDARGRWHRRKPQLGSPTFSAQEFLMARASSGPETTVPATAGHPARAIHPAP